MNNPLSQTPPDDTGTDTLKRFRYQAQIALPFCLACARQEKVLSVIMEHFEDIVLEYEDYWQFIQVKSRNSDQRDWNFSQTIEALKSLYRAFQSTSDISARYSLFLEGNLSAKNELKVLASSNPNITSSSLKKVAEELEIDESECEAFLKVVIIHPGQTSHANITAHNIRLIGQISSHTSAKEIEALEQRLTDEILRAMSCDRLENLLYQYILQADAVEEADKAKVSSKRLTANSITDILGSFSLDAYPLLLRITDFHTPLPSNLEKKLIAGGATDRIINDAKNLRANASIRESEILASGFLNEDKKIIDVQIRLETLTNSIVEHYEDSEKPAKTIWREVLDELTKKNESVDPNRIYKQDPYLLLGAICGISDECRIDWGVKIA
jgi:hypothetical protein